MAASSVSGAQPSLLPAEGGSQQLPGRPLTLSNLSSQTSTVSQTAGKVKPVTLCVYTMLGKGYTQVFPAGRLTTAQQITENTLAQLGIPVETGGAVFSLWLTSRHLQLQLKHYHLPCKLFKRWKELLSQYTNASYDEVNKDEPILMLQRDAFFPLKEERQLLDPKKDNKKTIELLYCEAVSNTLKVRYPLSRDDLATLAGLQAAVDVAQGSRAGEPSGADINKYFPAHHLTSASPVKKSIGRIFKQKSTDKDATSLQQDFSRAFSEACKRSSDAHQLRVLYLQHCWHKPYYGSVLFRGQIQRPFKAVHLVTYNDKTVTVAINTECLHIFENSTPPDVMLYLTYDQLSWEFEVAEEEGEDFYSSLWLEFDSFLTEGEKVTKVAKRVQIFSRQAPMMDAMIARCVADIDHREEQFRLKRLEQNNTEFSEEVSIRTYKEGEAPRTQRPEKNYKEDKLNCAIYSEEGDLLESGFTLSRVLRRRGRKPVSAADSPSSTQPLMSAAAAAGEEEQGVGLPLEELNTTQASQESKESKSSTDL